MEFMTSDLDIFCTANVLIRERGEEAGLEALPCPRGRDRPVRSVYAVTGTF